MYYFDTSALVKRYAAEGGSAWVSALLDARPNVFVSTFTFVEGVAALSRRSFPAKAATLARFEADFHRGFSRIAVSPAVLEAAAWLARERRLRAGDALQLASALVVFERLPRLVFVCADDDLNAVARVEGMRAENPNEHA
jgi:predicted nucleic acid-binding protein